MKANSPSIVRTAVITPALITLAMAKAHVRRDNDYEDSNIQIYLDAALAYVEEHTGWALSESSYVQAQRFWDCETEDYRLMRYPVNSITSIKYYDKDRNLQTLATDKYRLIGTNVKPSTIVPLDKWPETDAHIGSVSIEFKAGPTSLNAIPPILQSAVLQLVTLQFENRSPIVIERRLETLPEGIRWLMDKERIRCPLL